MKKLAIFGLGNPGEKYKNTRHNVGFLVLNKMANQEKWKIENKLESEIIPDFFPLNLMGNTQGLYAKTILVKPATFMNQSGQSASKVMNYFNIPKEDILVIQDDLDLPFGSIKFSKDSGPAGHNGIKSIIENLGDQDFVRLRVGIANKIYNEQNITSEIFVLENFNAEEKTALDENLLEEISKAVKFYIENGFEETKNKYNKSAMPLIELR